MASIYSRYFDNNPLEPGRHRDNKPKGPNPRLGKTPTEAPRDADAGCKELHIFRKSLEKSFEELAGKAEVLGQPKSPGRALAGAAGSSA